MHLYTWWEDDVSFFASSFSPNFLLSRLCLQHDVSVFIFTMRTLSYRDNECCSFLSLEIWFRLSHSLEFMIKQSWSHGCIYNEFENGRLPTFFVQVTSDIIWRSSFSVVCEVHCRFLTCIMIFYLEQVHFLAHVYKLCNRAFRKYLEKRAKEKKIVSRDSQIST